MPACGNVYIAVSVPYKVGNFLQKIIDHAQPVFQAQIA